MAGCATPTRSAGHAPAGATADTKLTFQPDHPVGAGQMRAVQRLSEATLGTKRGDTRLTGLLKDVPIKTIQVDGDR